MFDYILKGSIFVIDSLLFVIFTFFIVGLILYLTFKTKNNDRYLFALSLIPSVYLLFEFISKSI